MSKRLSYLPTIQQIKPAVTSQRILNSQACKGKGGCPYLAAPQKQGAAFRAGLLAAPRDVEELVTYLFIYFSPLSRG